MIGQVYNLRFMRWKIVAIFARKNGNWARLKCLDKRGLRWDVPVSFLELMKNRKVS